MSERKIVDYVLAYEYTYECFQNNVKKLILKGYQPYGSPYRDTDANTVQAMVKYEEKEKCQQD